MSIKVDEWSSLTIDAGNGWNANYALVNTGKYNDKFYRTHHNGNGISLPTILYVYSCPYNDHFGTAATVVKTYNTGNMRFVSPEMCLRIFDDEIYAVIDHFLTYSTDGGGNWTEVSLGDWSIHIVDIIRSPTGTIFLFINRTDTNKIQFLDLAGNIVATQDVNTNACAYVGCRDDTLYKFVYYKGSTDDEMRLASFNYVDTIATVEVLTVTKPTSFSYRNQIYQKNDTLEVLIDYDYFRFRISAGTWRTTSEATNTYSGVIWTNPSVNLYSVLYYFWRGTLFEINENGYPIPIGYYFEDLKCGFDTWISGNGILRELTYVSLDIGDGSIIQDVIGNFPSGNVNTSYTFSNNCCYRLRYNNDLIIRTFFKKKSTNNDTGMINYEILSPLSFDLNKIVTVSGTMTWDEAIKEIIDAYCIYIWYNTGIDAIVGDWTFAFKGTFKSFLFVYAELATNKRIYILETYEIYVDDFDVDSGIDCKQSANDVIFNVISTPLLTKYSRINCNYFDANGVEGTKTYWGEAYFPELSLQLPMISDGTNVQTIVDNLGTIMDSNILEYKFTTSEKKKGTPGLTLTVDNVNDVAITLGEYGMFSVDFDLFKLQQTISIHSTFVPKIQDAGGVNPVQNREAISRLGDLTATNITSIASIPIAPTHVANASAFTEMQDAFYCPMSSTTAKLSISFYVPVAGNYKIGCCAWQDSATATVTVDGQLDVGSPINNRTSVASNSAWNMANVPNSGDPVEYISTSAYALSAGKTYAFTYEKTANEAGSGSFYVEGWRLIKQ